MERATLKINVDAAPVHEATEALEALAAAAERASRALDKLQHRPVSINVDTSYLGMSPPAGAATGPVPPKK